MYWLFLIAVAILPAAGSQVDAQDVSVSTVTVSTGTAVAPEPYLWPVAPRVQNQKVQIVSPFGPRELPDTHERENHEGVDFGVPAGTQVHASRPGLVLFGGLSGMYASRVDKKQKGRLLILRHADGMSTRYVHIDRLLVRPRQAVTAGQVVGLTGDSDEWSQPVLHFEIRDAQGHAIDPQTVLQDPVKKNVKAP